MTLRHASDTYLLLFFNVFLAILIFDLNISSKNVSVNAVFISMALLSIISYWTVTGNYSSDNSISWSIKYNQFTCGEDVFTHYLIYSTLIDQMI